MILFKGTNTEFKAWIRAQDPNAFLRDLDASISRHPAGKGRI